MTTTGNDTLGTRSTLSVGGKNYAYYSLDKAAAKLGDVSRLPFSMKVLLENLLRNEDGRTVTKDDILAAVIALRSDRTQSMLASWTQDAATPVDRLRCFAEMLVRNRHDIQRYGCPVGTLCAELAKLDHPAQGDAGMIFGQFRDWLRTQFSAPAAQLSYVKSTADACKARFSVLQTTDPVTGTQWSLRRN